MWVAVKDTEQTAFLPAEAEANELSKNYEQNQERVTQLDQMTSALQTLLYNCPVCNRVYWFRGEDGQVEVFAPV